jgi:hypothetical protein
MMGGLNSRIGAALGVIFFLGCFFAVKSEPVSWNDTSRVAAIESLVERGTWAIDGSSWVNVTQDKILIHDAFYSDKMPLFSVIGAGVYALIHLLGGSLASNCSAAAQFCAYSWLTLALVSVPAAILMWLFFDHAIRMKMPIWAAIVGTIALGAGTMILPYSLVLNHHVPAAACVFASFFLLRQGAAEEIPPASPLSRRDMRIRLFVAGLLGALAISFDVLSGVIAATLFGIAVVRYRSWSLFFVLGALVPLAATAVLDYQIAHTILPPYTVTDAYNYPGSAFPASIAGNGTPDDYAAYAFRMFLGGKGLFAYNPLLLFALVGAVSVALNRLHSMRVEGAMVLLGFIALCIYLATNTGNYGGTSYGERWFIVSIPILFSFVFFVPPLGAASWRRAAWIIFMPLLALSVFSSFQGAQAPWQDYLPPLQMTRDVNHFPIFGFRLNFPPK